MARVTLSLGSNLGDKRGNIAKALSALDAGGARILTRSADYRTEPWGPVAQDWFVNACAVAETELAPHDLLALCLRVEQELGRVREVKWGPRVIDIDILTYDDLEVNTPSLMLPHPYLAERAFVLVPLAEIAPDLKLGRKMIADILADLNCSGITKLA
ncbi:2-amino-4-hydroxy-6-hydroxymethyldihydropteridine diphosphokinase [Microvirga sp. KLBC 81]|uniref:2-amino-4-hydroxy-6- hydroxymethyldihydropteridine diphosphokinase n=1 Tax=Microvirga sp. KLBC 81 TaxID=1862707 RepID=UPI000D508F5A|nr:2-amino-4-hydroxy-6-hydroxymethyldihydropteridine diphosphokinase [Microvirga sp. KLBC 81]PVE23959.1 2-amino-4-hydroxy-6-hydroxymethyldihydropteridine diphosphokinase [Microvirga sp. KLBC 81]